MIASCVFFALSSISGVLLSEEAVVKTDGTKVFKDKVEVATLNAGSKVKVQARQDKWAFITLDLAGVSISGWVEEGALRKPDEEKEGQPANPAEAPAGEQKSGDPGAPKAGAPAPAGTKGNKESWDAYKAVKAALWKENQSLRELASQKLTEGYDREMTDPFTYVIAKDGSYRGSATSTTFGSTTTTTFEIVAGVRLLTEKTPTSKEQNLTTLKSALTYMDPKVVGVDAYVRMRPIKNDIEARATKLQGEIARASMGRFNDVAAGKRFFQKREEELDDRARAVERALRNGAKLSEEQILKRMKPDKD